jgi:hypothetical protein
MVKIKTKAVEFSIPGWVKVSLEPNDTERRAAWQLYVELATRVASQPFDRTTGSVRAVLESMHAVTMTAQDQVSKVSAWRAGRLTLPATSRHSHAVNFAQAMTAEDQTPQIALCRRHGDVETGSADECAHIIDGAQQHLQRVNIPP